MTILLKKPVKLCPVFTFVIGAPVVPFTVSAVNPQPSLFVPFSYPMRFVSSHSFVSFIFCPPSSFPSPPPNIHSPSPYLPSLLSISLSTFFIILSFLLPTQCNFLVSIAVFSLYSFPPTPLFDLSRLSYLPSLLSVCFPLYS